MARTGVVSRSGWHRGRCWIGGAAALGVAFGSGQGGLAIAADAPGGRSIAGDYVCKADCRLSDAPPSIELDGPSARCHSELGGIFYGTVLSSTSVSCFNMTGTLSENGDTIRWSNGGVWERRR